MEKIIQWQEDSGMKSDLGPLIAIEGEEDLIWFEQIGQFDAEFLLDFFSQELGAYYYNHGLYDAQAALAAKLEDVQDAIYQLEQHTDFKR